MLEEKLSPLKKEPSGIPNLLELHPDVFVEFEEEPVNANNQGLYLNIGLDFFVSMDFEEANGAVPKMIEFHEQRLAYNEHVLGELVEFRERVLESLNEIRLMSEGGMEQ